MPQLLGGRAHALSPPCRVGDSFMAHWKEKGGRRCSFAMWHFGMALLQQSGKALSMIHDENQPSSI